MKKLNYLIAGILLLAVSCDKNESHNGGGGAITAVSQDDRSFVLNASMANFTEVSLGQMATVISTDSAIIAFATMMIDEHQQAQLELQMIADSVNVPAPDSMDEAHGELIMQLSQLTGYSFDSLYIHSQVADHAAALTLYQEEKSSGVNTMIKAYAAGKLSAIQMHKDLAEDIADDY